MGLAGDRFGLARSFALVPLSYLVMVALVLAAGGRGGNQAKSVSRQSRAK